MLRMDVANENTTEPTNLGMAAFLNASLFDANNSICEYLKFMLSLRGRRTDSVKWFQKRLYSLYDEICNKQLRNPKNLWKFIFLTHVPLSDYSRTFKVHIFKKRESN